MKRLAQRFLAAADDGLKRQGEGRPPRALEDGSPVFRAGYAAYLEGYRVIIIVAACFGLIVLPLNVIHFARAGDYRAVLGIVALGAVYFGLAYLFFRVAGRWLGALRKPR